MCDMYFRVFPECALRMSRMSQKTKLRGEKKTARCACRACHTSTPMMRSVPRVVMSLMNESYVEHMSHGRITHE